VRRPALHALLLVAALAEILELEVVPSGWAHHVWDAAVVAIYAVAAGRIGPGRAAGWAVALLGGVPWTIDLLGLTWRAFDLESALWAAAHGALVVLLARRLFRVERVSASEILDAVSLYVITGIGFANVYGLLLHYDPGALAGPSLPAAGHVPYDLVLYYSFITQLTVGYGDLSPASPLSRVMSILQALFGIMFVAILISRFVALHSAEQFARRSDPGARRAGPEE